jgi:hypothetical protein
MNTAAIVILLRLLSAAVRLQTAGIAATKDARALGLFFAGGRYSIR